MVLSSGRGWLGIPTQLLFRLHLAAFAALSHTGRGGGSKIVVYSPNTAALFGVASCAAMSQARSEWLGFASGELMLRDSVLFLFVADYCLIYGNHSKRDDDVVTISRCGVPD